MFHIFASPNVFYRDLFWFSLLIGSINKDIHPITLANEKAAHVEISWNTKDTIAPQEPETHMIFVNVIALGGKSIGFLSKGT